MEMRISTDSVSQEQLCWYASWNILSTSPIADILLIAAKLQGLVEDLSLTPEQYQTGLSILFVAYVLMQVPSNLMLNWCGKPSWYIGFFVIAWGLVSAVTSQVKSYGGIVACRFVLGLVGKFGCSRPIVDSNPSQRHRSSLEFCSTSRSGTPRPNFPCAWPSSTLDP